MLRPLVVAVEGRCYAGKTTFAHRLASLTGGVAIPEYAQLGPLPCFPPATVDDARAGLDHLLAIERTRAQLATAAGAGVVILDRCPLSLIAHEYAMQALGVPTDAGYALSACSAAAAHGHILTPDTYVVLHISDQATAMRRRARGPVPAHLDHPAVRRRIDSVYQQWMRQLPASRRLLLDGSQSPRRLADQATALLRPASSPPPPPWDTLAPPALAAP